MVGGWVQDERHVVRLRLPEQVSAAALRTLHAEATRLTAWLDGRRVFATYPSRVMRSGDHERPDREQARASG